MHGLLANFRKVFRHRWSDATYQLTISQYRLFLTLASSVGKEDDRILS